MNIEKTIAAWHRRLDAVSKKVESEFGPLSSEQLNWKPSDEEWSIAEVLAHLIQLNNSYIPILASANKGEQDMGFTAKLDFLVRWLGNLVRDSVEPTRSKKMKTFPIWEPQQSDVSGQIVSLFIQQQRELKDRMSAHRNLLEKDIVIPSPANRYIVYKLSVAFELMVTHEERHLNQALEVLSRSKTR